MNSAAQVDRLASRLRVAELVLTAVAAAALGWVIVSWTATVRDQATWAHELEEMATAVSTSPRGKALVAPPQPGATIGRLEVPRLGLTVITREGTDARTLRRAVGHVPATALPGQKGNAAFAGHRDTFFRQLKHVREGDEIVVTTTAGRHHYVVRDTRVVLPNDVSVLDPTTAATLTLVTCYPFNYIGSAPKRFIVRASLVPDSTTRTTATLTPR
jgi:sortase A